jgi:hypothetical protein
MTQPTHKVKDGYSIGVSGKEYGAGEPVALTPEEAAYHADSVEPLKAEPAPDDKRKS